jgi:squalene cyclase
MKVMGLTWAKGDAEAIQAAAKQLLGEQRADGGWAQLPTLASDAYATGEALMALHDAGILSTRDRAWKRGIEYLLRTQQADGTWHVKSRSYPFQPYFESGYPYGPDQWISVAGASWATMALLQNERQLTARR